MIGISRKGLYIAYKIVKSLNYKLDILLSTPIVSPINKKLDIAMIGETKEIIINYKFINSFDISEDFIHKEAYRQYNKIIIYEKNIYRKGKSITDLTDKTVIIVDDCVDTGLRLSTAIKTIKSLKAKNIAIAIPMIDNLIYENIYTHCDNLFCIHRVNNYISKDYFYKFLKRIDRKLIIQYMNLSS